MKKILIFLSFLLCLSPSFVQAVITTPYLTSIDLKQINSADKERTRLCQGHPKFDRQPTGFFVDSGMKIVVNVELLTPAFDNAMPIISIGTLGFNVPYSGKTEGRSKTDIPLKAGTNTISASQHKGGLIYLSFVTNAGKAPQGLARITFTEESGHVRAPQYVYGKTTDNEFKEMMDTYQTPDVVYYSDYAVVVATRESATQYSRNINKKNWMDGIHTLLANEDTISGLDDNDPNPLHHRMKAGEVRYLLVENTSTSPHASSAGYTGYPSGSRHRYLTAFSPATTGNNNSWMLGHEIGHQHQQPAYMIPLSVESTVNIYSYVEERYMVSTIGETYNRTSASRWQTAQNTYLKYPIEKRIYNMDDKTLETLIGFNRDELRFMPWEQLFLLFGDNFYKNLHRVVREEKVATGGNDDERRFYLIWKASLVSGYDLREFFNQWGIRIMTDNTLKGKLQTYFEKALALGKIVDLPQPIGEIIGITGQKMPAWAPLTLRGITTSMPENEILDRTNWTITTSIQGASDVAIGGDKPDYIIDGSTITAFSFVKPGRYYGGINAPSGYVPSFTIDMQTPVSFNLFKYQHRTSGNLEEMLRARKLSFYGKNSETDEFQPIKENVVINYSENKDVIQVEFPEVSCRYVRVDINEWNVASGNTVQVAEFDLGIIRPEMDTKVQHLQANPEKCDVYPNPIVSGHPFFVRTDDEWTDANLSIYTASGQKVWKQRLVDPTNEINLSVPEGFYFLQIEKDVRRTTSKLLVTKR
jgi:hypothetical protein